MQCDPQYRDAAYFAKKWQRIWSSITAADILKAKSKNWGSLKYWLSPRERDITWRIRHGAICTPQMAFQMGLVSSNMCFFCTTMRPSWKHIIVCSQFDDLWAAVKCIVNNSGVLWDNRKIFTGFPKPTDGALNHIINAAYLVVYEMIILKINHVPHAMNPVLRWKQIIFEMIYSDFKSKAHDEVTRLSFESYWRKLDFLQNMWNEY